MYILAMYYRRHRGVGTQDHRAEIGRYYDPAPHQWSSPENLGSDDRM
jgi:hypothetical protein